jgi:UDP-N-acetylglucosamine 2-epimerase (non-hydrolysing)
MSDAFFTDLDLPQPDIHLGVGSGSHAAQTAAVMERFEPVVLKERPDWVLVVGDVNSTIACALVCVKLGIKVAHVEAGLRSRDRSMPEEINRLLTDQIADLLLTPSQDGDANLLAEGIPQERIRFVGNIMIDSLFKNLERARESRVKSELGLKDGQYAVLTLHRPSNVDDRETFERILSALEAIAYWLPIIFPVHPRTRKTIAEFGLSDRIAASTLRENTERPITVELGTNVVVGTETERIVTEAMAILDGSANKQSRQPPLWDGHTADRVLTALLEIPTRRS